MAPTLLRCAFLNILVYKFQPDKRRQRPRAVRQGELSFVTLVDSRTAPLTASAEKGAFAVDRRLPAAEQVYRVLRNAVIDHRRRNATAAKALDGLAAELEYVAACAHDELGDPDAALPGLLHDVAEGRTTPGVAANRLLHSLELPG